MNLKTSYLGLELKNPLIVSSCPLTSSVTGAVAIETAGAAAIVVRSIFEEQIRAETAQMDEALADYGTGAALDYLRADLGMRLGPETYIDGLRAIRKAVTIPVIASINCISPDQWVTFARKIETAGADALELNVYDIPQSPDETSDAVESRHLALVQAIRAEIKLPVTIKLSPYYTHALAFTRKLDRLGVNGLVLFNRFLQPDIDIATERLRFEVNFSREQDLRLPLRWVAILRDHLRCDIAISGGVHTSDGLAKGLLVGANVAYCCSALYHNPDTRAVVGGMLDGLTVWMRSHGYADLAAFRGTLRERVLGDGEGFERAHYVKVLSSSHE
ncbi:MAG: dihydroorotate dehydrogenase-like protein [Lentisphaerae bacterium]|nr:dihydroorotate dehydrogenase-like protein [Lentisphaerota bacterium]